MPGYEPAVAKIAEHCQLGNRLTKNDATTDPETLTPLGGSEVWHEYLGSSIYADLAVTETPDPNDADLLSAAARRYVHAGDGRLIGWYDGDATAGEWRFVHADMLGTTRLVTDEDGFIGTGPSTAGGSAVAYSAFGEILAQANPGGAAGRSRYGYCGGWGYQNDGLGHPARAIGLLHVGARYLDPAIGRFVQRDALSIANDLNVYAYVSNSPPALVDPTGYWTLTELQWAQACNLLMQRAALGTIRATEHAAQQAILRVVSPNAVLAAINNGQAFFDPRHGTLAFYYQQVYVAISMSSGGITTVGPWSHISPRLLPLP